MVGLSPSAWGACLHSKEHRGPEMGGRELDSAMSGTRHKGAV